MLLELLSVGQLSVPKLGTVEAPQNTGLATSQRRCAHIFRVALAIGILTNAAIVMMRNGYRHLSARRADGPQIEAPERRRNSDQSRERG